MTVELADAILEDRKLHSPNCTSRVWKRYCACNPNEPVSSKPEVRKAVEDNIDRLFVGALFQ